MKYKDNRKQTYKTSEVLGERQQHDKVEMSFEICCAHLHWNGFKNAQGCVAGEAHYCSCSDQLAAPAATNIH